MKSLDSGQHLEPGSEETAHKSVNERLRLPTSSLALRNTYCSKQPSHGLSSLSLHLLQLEGQVTHSLAFLGEHSISNGQVSSLSSALSLSLSPCTVLTCSSCVASDSALASVSSSLRRSDARPSTCVCQGGVRVRGVAVRGNLRFSRCFAQWLPGSCGAR